jgi:hypothetical protein
MKLLIAVPGIGENNFEDKKIFLEKNLKKIKETFTGETDVILFNYSDNDFDFLNNTNVKIIKEKNIIGQYIFKYLTPEFIKNYDYIILMLDDIEIVDNDFNIDNMISLYIKHQLNIISPSLTKDSKYTWKFMLEDNNYQSKIRITNFCEYFFYLMDINSFNKYHSLLDENSNWLWGIDLCLNLQNIKTGVINNYKIKHHFIGESYRNDLPNPRIEMDKVIRTYGRIEKMENLEVYDI